MAAGKSRDEYIAELVANAPPLNERQRAAIRAAAASVSWTEPETDEESL